MLDKTKVLQAKIDSLNTVYEKNFQKLHTKYEGYKEAVRYRHATMITRYALLRQIEDMKDPEYYAYIEKEGELSETLNDLRKELIRLQEKNRVHVLCKDGVLFDDDVGKFWSGKWDCDNNRVYEGDILTCGDSSTIKILFHNCRGNTAKGFYAIDLENIPMGKIRLVEIDLEKYKKINAVSLDKKKAS